MVSELSFLIDLLLKHKLPPATKELVAKRIGEVEEKLSMQPMHSYAPKPQIPQAGMQAPSTQAILARNPDLAMAVMPPPEMPPIPPTQPVAVVAQTLATAQAMNSRNQAIAESIAGKIDKVTGRPRKF